MVIRDDKIFAVNPSLSTDAAAADNVIDATGKYLIPGLWDMHVHFLYEPKLTEHMADLFLQYGVTSVRDTGGNLEELVKLRKVLNNAQNPTPHIFLAPCWMDSFQFMTAAIRRDPHLASMSRRATRHTPASKHLKLPVPDLIKIYELVQPDVYQALVDAARAESTYRVPRPADAYRRSGRAARRFHGTFTQHRTGLCQQLARSTAATAGNLHSFHRGSGL